MLFRNWEGVDDRWPPVVRVADHTGAPHLLVTRHALVRQVLADPVTFRPDNALDAVTPVPVAALRVLTSYGFRLPPTLANNGTASHPAIRAGVAEATSAIVVTSRTSQVPAETTVAPPITTGGSLSDRVMAIAVMATASSAR